MRTLDVMTRQVITVGPDTSISEAARLMLENRISGLPVVEGRGRLIGIVTEGDFLRRTEAGTTRRRPRWLEFLIGPGRLADEFVRTHGRKVEDVMTPDPRIVTEDTPLEDAVQLMERNNIKRLPVVRGDQLVGILSRANLLSALASLARIAPPAAKDDAATRDRILAELERQPWKALGLNVVVQNGNVELSGIIIDERERQALKVTAENVPGVKAVHDHLTWVEPMSGMAFGSPEDEAARTGDSTGEGRDELQGDEIS
jgi:CBS domain-containing protein